MFSKYIRFSRYGSGSLVSPIANNYLIADYFVKCSSFFGLVCGVDVTNSQVVRKHIENVVNLEFALGYKTYFRGYSSNSEQRRSHPHHQHVNDIKSHLDLNDAELAQLLTLKKVHPRRKITRQQALAILVLLKNNSTFYSHINIYFIVAVYFEGQVTLRGAQQRLSTTEVQNNIVTGLISICAYQKQHQIQLSADVYKYLENHSISYDNVTPDPRSVNELTADLDGSL